MQPEASSTSELNSASTGMAPKPLKRRHSDPQVSRHIDPKMSLSRRHSEPNLEAPRRPRSAPAQREMSTQEADNPNGSAAWVYSADQLLKQDAALMRAKKLSLRPLSQEAQ